MTKTGARERLPQKESREKALAAAHAILVEQGPQAVTLKAVAARIGRTHANLLHHFGSAHGLQTELGRTVGEHVTRKIGDAVLSVRRGEADPRSIVDTAFDAFAKEGVGPLCSWMALSGDFAALAPILKAIHGLVDELADPEHTTVPQITLALTLTALGDTLLGAAMADELGLPRETAREIAIRQLLSMVGPDYGKKATA